MAEALRYEKADELGNPIRRLKTPNPATARPPRKQRQVKRPRIDAGTSVDVPSTDVFIISSSDDDDYEGATEGTTSTSSLLEEGFTDTDWPGEVDTPYMLVRDLPPTLNAEVRFIMFHLCIQSSHMFLACRYITLEDSSRSGPWQWQHYWKAHPFDSKVEGLQAARKVT